MKTKPTTPRKPRRTKGKVALGSPRTPKVIQTRLRSRQRNLESFGFPVVRVIDCLNKNLAKKEEDPQLESENKCKDLPRVEEIICKPKSKRGRKPKANKLIVNVETNTKDASRDADDVTNTSNSQLQTETSEPILLAKRKGQVEESKTPEESFGKEVSVTSVCEDSLNSTSPDDSEIKSIPVAPKKRGRKKRVVKEESSEVAATKPSDVEGTLVQVEDQQKITVKEVVNATNSKQNDISTDCEARRKFLKESFRIEEGNSNEVFIPEVVIWGDRINQTIREVSNFYIVGSKDSPPAPRSEQLNVNEPNSLKKIINKPFTRRRAKAKQVQLMTLGEHKRILQACLNSSGDKICTDFKVDSLFRRGMETRRKNNGSSVYIDTLETQDGPVRLETSTDPKSFTIGFEDGHIVIDDVANYESVDSSRVRSKTCNHHKSCSECDHQRRKRAPKLSLGMDGNWDPQCDEHGKPKCTYTDLIERALAENPHGLTVSEIYNWISTSFPYYSPNDDRWKNSVRHNLSINPYFKKGSKSKNGAGHVWTISEECHYFRPALKRRHTSSSIDLDMSQMKTDTERAVASILGQYTRACADENLNRDNDDSSMHNGMSYCIEDSEENEFNTQERSSPSNYPSVTEHGDEHSPSNQMSTIEISDLDSVMQSTCLLNLEEFSRRHGLIYVSQTGEEDESNKENLDDNSPVEYTILEASSFIDATGLIPQSHDQHDGSSQVLHISQEDLETLNGSQNLSELSFNTTSSMGDIFAGNDFNMPFQFDSQEESGQFQ